jgi:hypothetical protein
MKKLFLLLIIPFLSFGQTDSLNVLFIGNSYTATNNLPNIVSTIANSMGDYLYTESNLIGGATLQTHVNNTITNNLIMNGDWDHVVIQEQSQYPSFPLWQVEQDVFPYAAQLNQFISDYNECGQTMFFMTWGRENGDTNNCPNWPPVCTYEGMDDLLHERYMIMANDNDAFVSPVGAVWRYIRDNQYDIDLYSADGSHPSFLGSYVAGVCFYTAIFQKDPLDIPWNEEWDMVLSESDSEIIHEIVKIVVYDNLDEWNITEGQVNSCQVLGCMDTNACNYNDSATEDDGSCFFPTSPCGEQFYCNNNNGSEVSYGFNGVVNNDCECIIIIGCTDPEACNYISTATTEWAEVGANCWNYLGLPCYFPGMALPSPDGTCLEISEECECCYSENGQYICGCLDEFALNYDPNALLSNDSCLYSEVKNPEIKLNKKPIIAIDILGRETTNKGFQLDIYDDRTVEKKYLIK